MIYIYLSLKLKTPPTFLTEKLRFHLLFSLLLFRLNEQSSKLILRCYYCVIATYYWLPIMLFYALHFMYYM